MNKAKVLSLINVLKILKNIMIKHNEALTNSIDVRSLDTMNRLLFQRERFKKITDDINSLMKHALNQKDFELYSENSNRMLRDLSKREESINEQVKKAISDFQLDLKDLKKKVLEFDNILNEISDSLK